MKKNNTKFLSKSSIDKINDSRSIAEGYPHMLEVVFNEAGNNLDIKYNTKTKNLDVIRTIYYTTKCSTQCETKFRIYQLL